MWKVITFVLIFYCNAQEVYLQEAACDPGQTIKQYEGNYSCMYYDTHDPPLKTIGIGFNLEKPGARNLVQAVGANYDAIFNGPVTNVLRVPCNCNKVTCLTGSQINSLFQTDVQRAVTLTRSAVNNFDTLCCNVQVPLVDIQYQTGHVKRFDLFIKFINILNYQAAADDLSTTKLCTQTPKRCQKNVDSIKSGCNCFGNFPKACPATKSCCSGTQTCCTAPYTFGSSVKKTFTESWCCPFNNGVCCSNDPSICCRSDYPICCPSPMKACCPAAYPICCPSPMKGCCPAAYPICSSDGKCYNNRNHFGISIPQRIFKKTRRN